MMKTFWTLTCLAGIWGFLIAAIGLILNGFPARDVFDARKAAKWGAALLVCFVAWVLGMANA
jgi:hypothetical protein